MQSGCLDRRLNLQNVVSLGAQPRAHCQPVAKRTRGPALSCWVCHRQAVSTISRSEECLGVHPSASLALSHAATKIAGSPALRGPMVYGTFSRDFLHGAYDLHHRKPLPVPMFTTVVSSPSDRALSARTWASARSLTCM